MNKELEQLYNAVNQMEELGLPVSKDQMKRLEQAEKAYVEEELLPCMKAVATPLIKGLRQPLTLIVDYDPAQGIVVKTGNRKIGRVGRKPKKYEECDTVDTATSVHEDEIVEGEVLLTHAVDWSPFEYGFTIEHKFHEAIFKAVGHYIPRGSGVDVQLLFNGTLYDAKITNANRQVKGDTIRLLYRGKKNNFGTRLKQELPDVYNFIKRFKETNGGRAQCPLPSDLRRLLILKETEKEQVYKVECKAG